MNIQMISIITFLSAFLPACIGEKPTSANRHADQGLYHASFSKHGDTLLIASINHGASLWNTKQNERIYNWNHDKGQFTGMVAAALSGDGQYALTADQRRLVFWEKRSGQSLAYWQTAADILSVSLSENGDFALVGLRDFTAIFINIRQGDIVGKLPHSGKVVSVDLSANGLTALTGSDDGFARLWDMTTLKEKQKWQHDTTVIAVTLSDDAQLALSAVHYGQLKLWDTNSGELLQLISKGRYTSTSAIFSKNKNQILFGTTIGQIKLWDRETQKLVKTWQSPSKSFWKPSANSIYDLAFSRNQKEIMAIGSNGVSMSWDIPAKPEGLPINFETP